MEQNKARTYIFYALGEILLVVIGILIALQVNNWNEQRLNQQREKLLLKELHQEFVYNSSQLDSVFFYSNRAYQSVQLIFDQFPMDTESADRDTLSKHLYYSLWNYTFNPSQGVINSLVNTSSFELISNDSLRFMLISWNDIIADYQEEEIRAVENYYKDYYPYLKRYVKFDLSESIMFNDPKVDINFITTLEFENTVFNRLNDLRNSIDSDEYIRVKGLIEDIIRLSDPASP